MASGKDGGPAFPHTRVKVDGACITAEWKEVGMTLRDYFAGQALAGNCGFDFEQGPISANDLAIEAYAIADAMLKYRESNNG